MLMKCASLVNGEMALSRKFTILGIPPAFDAPWTKLLTGRERSSRQGKHGVGANAAFYRSIGEGAPGLKPFGRIIV
ncbi:hypothetical protein T281_15015 [Rhodomicrobium udaipurense JA643]|nr:hypothetical protein T281_15015 [Rhodomicrobium udaipurense JA643]